MTGILKDQLITVSKFLMSLVNPETPSTDITPQPRTSSGNNIAKIFTDTHELKFAAFKLQDLAERSYVVGCQNFLTQFTKSLLVMTSYCSHRQNKPAIEFSKRIVESNVFVSKETQKLIQASAERKLNDYFYSFRISLQDGGDQKTHSSKEDDSTDESAYCGYSYRKHEFVDTKVFRDRAVEFITTKMEKTEWKLLQQSKKKRFNLYRPVEGTSLWCLKVDFTVNVPTDIWLKL
jgi:hypothetical protein